MRKKHVLWKLFYSTLYLSTFTFGGGYVIVTLMKKRFVAEGYFEKHLSRTKKYYRAVRARLLQMLSQPPCSEYLTVLDAGAGLHMLLEVRTALSQQQLRQLLSRAGLHAPLLSDFYIGTPAPAAARRIVLHYADLSPEALAPSLRRLCALLAEVG